MDTPAPSPIESPSSRFSSVRRVLAIGQQMVVEATRHAIANAAHGKAGSVPEGSAWIKHPFGESQADDNGWLLGTVGAHKYHDPDQLLDADDVDVADSPEPEPPDEWYQLDESADCGRSRAMTLDDGATFLRSTAEKMLKKMTAKLRARNTYLSWLNLRRFETVLGKELGNALHLLEISALPKHVRKPFAQRISSRNIDGFVGVEGTRHGRKAYHFPRGRPKLTIEAKRAAYAAWHKRRLKGAFVRSKGAHDPAKVWPDDPTRPTEREYREHQAARAASGKDKGHDHTLGAPEGFVSAGPFPEFDVV